MSAICYVCKVRHDVDAPGGIPHRHRALEPVALASNGATLNPTLFPYRVTVYRGSDGVPVIEVDTDTASAPLDHSKGHTAAEFMDGECAIGQGADAPYLRVYVNDARVYAHSANCAVCGFTSDSCECCADCGKPDGECACQ